MKKIKMFRTKRNGYTFRQRYNRSELVHRLRERGMLQREIAVILNCSVTSVGNLERQYYHIMNSVYPISLPFGSKKRYGDNSAYSYKEQRASSLRRQAYFGWLEPEPWEPGAEPKEMVQVRPSSDNGWESIARRHGWL